MLPQVVQEKLDALPAAPGVYLFKDKKGEVVYVGKAKSLRSRVRSYFQAGSSDLRAFIPWLQRGIADLETFVTGSEKEAAILENLLIKDHHPRFNVKLRDDKEYLCLRLDTPHAWPRLGVVRKPAGDGARYYGPYHSATAARRTLHLINKHFQLRTCGDTELASRKRPCLQYQIKRCPAPCVYPVDRQWYGEQVDAVALFLKGRHDELSTMLRERMRTTARDMRFELAAVYRDQLLAIEKVREGQRVVSVDGADRDVLGIYREGDQVELALLYVRDGKLVDVGTFSVKGAEVPDEEIVAAFLAQHYGRRAEPDPPADLPPGASSVEGARSPARSPDAASPDARSPGEHAPGEHAPGEHAPDAQAVETQSFEVQALDASSPEPSDGEGAPNAPEPTLEERKAATARADAVTAAALRYVRENPRALTQEARGVPIPPEILLPEEPDGMEGIAEWLSESAGHKVVLARPRRGPRVDLLALATDNARHAFLEKRRSQDDVADRLKQLQERLRLPTIPHRIECCDISHLGGGDTVGAVVAMENGALDKKRYRTFHVKTTSNEASAGDDYAAMYEVLARRFRRGAIAQAAAASTEEDTPEDEEAEATGPTSRASVPPATERGTGWELPDLFVVDGGRGQLAVALAAAHDLGLHELPICGLAKERENILGETMVDRVYLPGQKNPVPLRTNSAALFFLARLRDEAHRVSNRAREKLGKSRRFRSALDDVAGIGEKTKVALLRALGTLEAVKLASDDALLAVPGVTRRHVTALRKAFPPKAAGPANGDGSAQPS